MAATHRGHGLGCRLAGVHGRPAAERDESVEIAVADGGKERDVVIDGLWGLEPGLFQPFLVKRPALGLAIRQQKSRVDKRGLANRFSQVPCIVFMNDADGEKYQRTPDQLVVDQLAFNKWPAQKKGFFPCFLFGKSVILPTAFKVM
jgi:hypothetical protein